MIHRRRRRGGIVAAALALAFAAAACTNADPQAPRDDGSVPVVAATLETDPVASRDDAADDPAIWRNAADPAGSLIVATDKRAGLHVYDLSGRRLSFFASPRLNNVDLRVNVKIRGVAIGGRPGILVAASDRRDPANAKLALFALDPVAKVLTSLGLAAVGPGEAYGLCLWKRARDAALFAFVVMKDGRIDQMAIDASGATATRVRSMRLGSQAEGCVVDDRTGLLYVAEEDVGLWRFNADPAAAGTASPVATADGVRLVADAEGLAIAPAGAAGGFLVASSQGDDSYVLYRLPGMTFAAKVRIGGGPVDAVGGTDGLEVALGDFGPRFPAGLLVVQDGDNAPQSQNFKLVDWKAVIDAIR